MTRRMVFVLVGVVVIVLAVVGAFALGGADRSVPSGASSTHSTKSVAPEVSTPSGAPSGTPATPGQSETKSPGAYVPYSEEAVQAASGTRILFFHAPWCPQCRALEADILSSGVPDGLTIFKIDYDSRQDLRQRYGVTIQTTLVTVDASGEKLESFVAYDEPTLAAVIENLC